MPPSSSPVVPESPAQASPKPKTHTNWDALTKAFCKPVTIYCQMYQLVRGQPYRDMSCHTRLPLKSEVLEAHTVNEHGGGFLLCLRQSDGKPSPMWGELADKQLEAHDFRCAVCDKAVRLHPTNLAPHMRPHAGMTRQAYGELQRNHPLATGFFNVLMKKSRPMIADEEQEAEFDASEF